MLGSEIKTRHDVIQRYYAEYDAGIAAGTTIPFTYPIVSLGAAVGLLFFLIPPKSLFHNRFVRYACFAFIFYWHTYLITNSRGLNAAPAFGVGIVSAWGTVWAAVLLVFNDAKSSFRRVQEDLGGNRPKAHRRLGSKHKRGPSNGIIEANGGPVKQRPPKQHRKRQSREITSLPPSEKELDEVVPTRPNITYYWQPYPTTPMSDRIDWILDIWTTYRGVGWSWKISGLPSLPLEVQKQLSNPKSTSEEFQDKPVSRTGRSRFDTYWSVVLHNMRLCVMGYLAIDILVTITHHDPYFWGIMDRPPAAWLPEIIRTTPVLLRSYHLLVGMCFIWLGLRTIFTLGAIHGVGWIGPRWLNVRGEPWLYPDHYGNYTNVFDRGLAGWWGGWWHQTFRYAFQAAGDWLISLLGLDHASLAGRTVALFAAFLLSGYLHASGSSTQPGETNPWGGPFMFFFWQPFGMMGEMLWHSLLKRSRLSQHIPRWLGRATNFVSVHAWFVLTAPLLIDDMARGGLFLMEPVMLSPMRGLGFGVEGDGWYCWEGRFLELHWDRANWIWSGVAV